MAEWRKVLFSDESKFQLFGSDGRKYVRRPTGTRYNSRYQIPTIKHGGGNVMVWGSFSYDGIGPLVEIKGTMDAIMYRDILTRICCHMQLKKCHVDGFSNKIMTLNTHQN